MSFGAFFHMSKCWNQQASDFSSTNGNDGTQGMVLAEHKHLWDFASVVKWGFQALQVTCAAVLFLIIWSLGCFLSLVSLQSVGRHVLCAWACAVACRGLWCGVWFFHYMVMVWALCSLRSRSLLLPVAFTWATCWRSRKLWQVRRAPSESEATCHDSDASRKQSMFFRKPSRAEWAKELFFYMAKAWHHLSIPKRKYCD